MKKLFLMMMFFSSISSHAIEERDSTQREKKGKTQSVRLELRGECKKLKQEQETRRKVSPKKTEEEKRKEELYDDWLFNLVMSPF